MKVGSVTSYASVAADEWSVVIAHIEVQPLNIFHESLTSYGEFIKERMILKAVSPEEVIKDKQKKTIVYRM